ncbi:MAG: dienelactone hydrolase family protein [Candidatus Binatia bacterium]
MKTTRTVILSLMSVSHSSAPSAAVLRESDKGKISLASLTLPENRFLTLTCEGKPVTIWGELSLPTKASGPFPAVVLAHGCGGLRPTVREWAKRLTLMGVATFALDSFGGRGIRETCTGQSRINRGSRIIDVYRGLELLATHPRIDPSRIALMGFSQGGAVTLLARQLRLQRLWMRGGREFATYLAFYPGTCNYRFLNETEVSDRPLRIFQGTADDWTPIGPCREYVKRMRAAGKDVEILEYAGAHHGFDNPRLPAARFRPEVLNSSNCSYVEGEPGRFQVLHRETSKPSSSENSCRKRGATIGYHPAAYKKAIEDVRTFLRRIFRISQGQ